MSVKRASSTDAPAGGRGEPHSSGISPQTLIIASVASAAASFTVARVWGTGTLVGAAAAPVIVALVAEFLRRPMRTVTATAKRVPPARHRDTRPRPDTRPHPDTRPRSHTITQRRRPRWRVAVATGLLAFAIVVGVFTVPELLAGYSITGNGRQTTFFGSSSSVEQTTSPATTSTITTSVTHSSTAPTTTTTHTATTLSTPTQTTVTATGTQTAAATTATTPVTTPAPSTTSPTTSTLTP